MTTRALRIATVLAALLVPSASRARADIRATTTLRGQPAMETSLEGRVTEWLVDLTQLGLNLSSLVTGTCLLGAVEGPACHVSAALDALDEMSQIQSSFGDQTLYELGTLFGLAFLGFVLPGLFSLPLSVALFEGGLSLRLTQIAVVRRDGSTAGPLRRLSRALATWSPALVAASLLSWQAGVEHHGSETEVQVGLLLEGSGYLYMAGFFGIFALGSLWATLHPERALQDRIAGTVLVPF